MEQADDARREAEAKKVAEGHYRVKRRGNEFLSDEEDEEGKPRRWTKKQRRQRRLDKEDGLFTLGDEANVFVQAYEEDLLSDNDIEEESPSPSDAMSPEKKTLTAHERQELLRARARRNDSVSNTSHLSQRKVLTKAGTDRKQPLCGGGG